MERDIGKFMADMLSRLKVFMINRIVKILCSVNIFKENLKSPCANAYASNYAKCLSPDWLPLGPTNADVLPW